MSTQTPLNRIVPRSILRHRPIAPDAVPQKPPRVPRASRPNILLPEANPELALPPFESSSPAQREKKQNSLQRNWLGLLGVGMLLALFVLFTSQSIAPWLTMLSNDLHYGRPRTFQIDAFVGHEMGKTPSHFIALNMNGRVEVIEFPGGDPNHTQIYVGPQIYGPDADLTPVTLHFVDPDHTGHPDMIVEFQDLSFILHNAQGKFVPDRPWSLG